MGSHLDALFDVGGARWPGDQVDAARHGVAIAVGAGPRRPQPRPGDPRAARPPGCGAPRRCGSRAGSSGLSASWRPTAASVSRSRRSPRRRASRWYPRCRRRHPSPPRGSGRSTSRGASFSAGAWITRAGRFSRCSQAATRAGTSDIDAASSTVQAPSPSLVTRRRTIASASRPAVRAGIRLRTGVASRWCRSAAASPAIASRPRDLRIEPRIWSRAALIALPSARPTARGSCGPRGPACREPRSSRRRAAGS